MTDTTPNTSDLVTLEAAARDLGIPVSEARLFVRTFGAAAREGRKAFVRIADMQPWLADRESQRRNFAAYMDAAD